MGVGWGVAFGPSAAAMDRQAFEIKRARQGFEEARFTDARAPPTTHQEGGGFPVNDVEKVAQGFVAAGDAGQLDPRFGEPALGDLGALASAQ